MVQRLTYEWRAFNNINYRSRTRYHLYPTNQGYASGHSAMCGHAYYADGLGDEWTERKRPKCKHCIKLIPTAIKRTIIGIQEE